MYFVEIFRNKMEEEKKNRHKNIPPSESSGAYLSFTRLSCEQAEIMLVQ